MQNTCVLYCSHFTSVTLMKVKSGGTYQSCCVVVKNMQRCVFAIPNVSVFQEDKIMKIEKDVLESRLSSTAFYTELHVNFFLVIFKIYFLLLPILMFLLSVYKEMATQLKTEMSKLLVERNVSSFTMKPVKVSKLIKLM